MAPVYLHDMFSYTTSITGRKGRNAHRLFVPQIRTNLVDGVCFIVEPLYGTLCHPPCMMQHHSLNSKTVI